MCVEEPKRIELNNLILGNLKELVMNSNGICVVRHFYLILIKNFFLD